jgi:hydrogenase nickel incorporation protein HypB
MCATCGCSTEGEARLTDMQTGTAVPLDGHHHSHEPYSHHDHHHEHPHEHTHSHDHSLQHGTPTVVSLEKEVLARNNLLAERNRGWLAGRGILALNLVSSPGAGKTTLLERTLRELSGELPFSVIEGDQETTRDAERIRATGCRVVQVNTGTGCHLDASMINRALEQLDPPLRSVVLIENVGNLVCPALFDLGERAKVLVVSVTEGEDKPLKYPHMFRASEILVLNKIDLMPHVTFDLDRFVESAHQINSRLQVLQTSATRGDGMQAWYTWLRGRISALGRG